MTSAHGKAIVIANSRAGASSKNKSSISDLLAAAEIDHETRSTEGPRHAIQLAREAVDAGARFIVAVGGDGTIHEVVNGMMTADAYDPELVLGIIPGGSGSDFIRTFGLPATASDAVEHLKGEPWFQIDIGKVTYQQGGTQVAEFFPNIAEAGLGGEVVRRAEKLPRRVGRLRYLISFWLTLARYSSTEGRVLLDDKTYEGRITNLVVANAQFFGGGMRIAPKAHPADGKFNVLIQHGTKMDYVSGISKVFKGEHLPSPAIKELNAAVVRVESKKPLQIEADGEVLGFTPATFEIIPNALRLKI
ncbi:MAG: diacylglycerol kinase family protein [Actinomycetota bacterium]|nr:diacylglycerol kinase family lipid kinase [Actinomycetota bacterium]